MATATARRRSGYAHEVEIGSHAFVADEPPHKGGNDEGPSPTDLLAVSLASCTAITVEMYADRKGWELPGLRVDVDVDGSLVKGDASYQVTMRLPAGLDPDQVDRLATIAGKCPVHKAIARETPISISCRAED